MRLSLLSILLGVTVLCAAPARALPAGASQRLVDPAPEPRPDVARQRSDIEGQTIGEIKFAGLHRVEADAVRAVIRTKEGATLSRTQIASDLRAIFGMTYFSDVQVESEPRPDGKLTLIFTLVEKPAIRKVVAEGNEEITGDDFKELIDLKAFSILDLAAVRRNVRKIHDKYVEKGFYLADVTYKLTPVAGVNEVDVAFVIEEHAKVQVRSIQFVGNHQISSKELRASMLTETGSWISFVTSAGNYREEMLEHDLAGIQSAYLDRGFINVHLQKPDVSLSPDKRFIYITIHVDEGQQYRIGKIDFSGDLLLTKDELRKRVFSTDGEIFNRSKLIKDRAALDDVAQDRGYAYANITPETAVNEDTRTIDLTFDTLKGKPVYIERIEIGGNTKTRDKVIRRELHIYEGELFSGTAMKFSKARVQALGFFETVELTTKKGSADDLITVSIQVKERPTGTFQVGAGFSTLESFIFTAQLSQNNLFGWGQVGSLTLQLSSLRQFVQLQFVDPYFLDSKFTLSANAFRTQLQYVNFIRSATGASLGLGYPLSEATRNTFVPKSITSWLEDARMYLTYTAEDIGVSAITQGTLQQEVGNQFVTYTLSSLSLALNIDKRNDRMYPSNGYMLNQSVEVAPSILGSGVQFLRLSGYARYYHPLFLGMVFKTQLNYGMIEPFGGSQIPISELYFVGGINSLRGYYLTSVSPLRPVGQRTAESTTTPFAQGGNKQIFINTELEMPIIEKIGIRAVVFYDMGDAYSQDESFFQDKQNYTWLGMLHSAGFGIRWFSPIGPLRFEWGFPLTPRPQDGPYDFEFTIGNFF